MVEASNNPAERPELRSATPQQRGPLAGSGAAPEDASGDASPESGSAATGTLPAAETATTEPRPGTTAADPAAGTTPAETPGRPPVETPATEATPAAARAEAAPAPAPAKPSEDAKAAGEAPAAEVAMKPNGDAKAVTETKTAEDEKKPIGDAKPNEDTKTTGDTKPDGDAKTAGDTKTAEDAKPDGDTKPDGDAKTAEDTKTAGDAKPDGGVRTAGTAVKARRRFRPLRATGRAVRGVVTWTRGPAGRVVVPGVLVATLVVLAGSFGAYLVPQALESAPAPSATPTFGGDQGSAPPAGASPGTQPGLPGTGGLPGLPGQGPTTGLPGAFPTQPAVPAARPADVLAGWAAQTGTRVGIPVVAVQAYGYAEMVLAQTDPGCRLSWTTLAAIGKVESSHGSFNGAVLGADGVAQPTILGLPLDGQGGRQLIADTDRGALDQDTTYDRAIGPMQFIPSTWKELAVDADRDGVTNPNDIDDAALTAANYLCKGSRDLSRSDVWWEAILSYNAVRPYAQKVYATAQDYGRRSKL